MPRARPFPRPRPTRRLGGLGVLGLLACSCAPSAPAGDPDAGAASSADDDAGPLPGDPDGLACEGRALRARPDAPDLAGPWAVGTRGAEVGRLDVEIFYPAVGLPPRDGQDAARFDVRDALPPSQRDRVPDEAAPVQTCDCAPGLALDEEHGPYPLVLFVHGTGAFATQSLSLLTHLASRGFVVLAANHPGLMLRDTLAFLCPDSASGPQDLDGDVALLLQALDDPSGDLQFLRGRIDPSAVALVGHSAGANAVAGLAGLAGVAVVVSMAGSAAVSSSPTLEQSLFLAAEDDAVVSYGASHQGFDGSPTPRRLVGLLDTGHLAFSDLCELENAAGQNLVEVANERQICGAFAASFLFDCPEERLAADVVGPLVKAAVTLSLEETLGCRPAGEGFAALAGGEGVREVVEVLQAP